MNSFEVSTRSRTEMIDITSKVQNTVRESGVEDGICYVYVPHTTAGVTINENADPDVTADMEKVLDRVVPWAADYAHCEGNTAAHVKSSMMGPSLQVIVEKGQPRLGPWQSIYFCEFDGPRSRKVWVT